MQTVVRLPIDAASEKLRLSGHNDKQLSTRAFAEKDVSAVSTSIYTNLWLGVKTVAEARMKYAAMPQEQMHGMTWKHDDYGFRVLQEDASEMARLATGRPFVTVTNMRCMEYQKIGKSQQYLKRFQNLINHGAKSKKQK